MHTKTGIEVLAYLKKFLLLIENPNILQKNNGEEFNNEEMKVFLRTKRLNI